MNPKEQEMNMFIKLTKTITLKVNPLTTIENLKKMVLEKESLSESEVDLQELHFLREKLKDEKKLVDYGIKPNSTLNLIVNKLSTIKLLFHIPSQQKTFELNVSILDNVKKIKSLINEKEGISSESYSLYYKGKKIEEYKTLASLKIETDSIFYVILHPKDFFSISIKIPGGEVLKIEVKSMYTVRDLKAILGSMLGCNVDQQTLVYVDDELEDWRALAHYNIGGKSELHMLEFKFQIFVKDWNGKDIVVDVRGDDRVSKVKSVVFEKLGVPADVYKLVYAGKSLEPGMALKSYNIEKDCTLNIVYLSRKGK